MLSKKEHILNIINELRKFRLCGPSDDPDEQTAVCVGYHYGITQLKRMAVPFIPESIGKSLNSIEVEMNNIYSVYEARAEIDALLPDIELIIQGLDESVFDAVGSVELKKGNMAEKQFANKDRELFYKIEIDIKNNPAKYREAGKWLDEFYNVENFWKRKKPEFDRLKEGKGKDTDTETKLALFELMFALKQYIDIDYCLQRIGEKDWNLELVGKLLESKYCGKLRLDGVKFSDRLQEALDDLIVLSCYRTIFIGLKEAKRILLITWLLTDIDAENSNLSLTKFEKWPWSEWGGIGRYNTSNEVLTLNKMETKLVRLDANEKPANEWLELVRLAWAKIETEKEYETGHETKTGKVILLESIRRACQDVDKLAENNVDFAKLSFEETAVAEAAVIEYLTKRFGEQDDALGNWPRDWHECPESWELYEAKIMEYRGLKAKASLDEVKKIAERPAETEQKNILQTKLDEVDNKIIELYQESQRQNIKMPSNEKIAKALYNKHITPKKLSREAIRKRTQKLRKDGLIGNPDDNKGSAKRCTDKHIEDLEGDGDVRQRF